MDIIKLKIYGFRVTKRQFLLTEGIVLLFLFILLGLLIYRDLSVKFTDPAIQKKIRIWTYVVVIMIVWVVIEAQFFLNRFVRAQLKIIQQQKEQIDLQHEEITDSIRYARRIQNAILPSESSIKRVVPHSFLMLKPKDIVSGDFCWVGEKESRRYFAVADCTGHGVPGAMVSVVCSDLLTRAIDEEGITSPAQILDFVSGMITSALGNNDSEVKDGMDIALCSLDEQNNVLEYAGANNPIYVIRDRTLTIHKADRQPVGKHTSVRPFTNHSIALVPGDLVYLFSDGFADQFGGAMGKKYKYSRFRDLLLEIHSLPLAEQESRLNDEFENWIGGGDPGNQVEQVDDVCVMGVRVSGR